MDQNPPNVPTKSVARDVFLYLLMVISLAWSATALGNILFQIINKYIPGVMGYYGSISGALRFSVASLVVLFPVLGWVLYFLKRDMRANPEKRDLKIRKWLLYFALFVAGLILLGDLVALVLGLLDGNTALNFILKVLVVFWLAGSVFYYFLKDLHEEAARGRAVVQWITIAVVVGAIVLSFFLIFSGRAYERDDLRVSHLIGLENQLINYWQTKQALPASLNDLADGTISGSGPLPADPITGAPYEYRVTGPRAYQFCATFEKDSQQYGGDVRVAPQVYGKGSVETWKHGQGRQCFNGTIDPDRFQPIPVPKSNL